MKLYTYEIDTCLGPHVRLGAGLDGRLVDLNLAGEALFAAEGEADPKAAADYFLPCDMVRFFWRGEQGRAAARRALDLVARGTVTAPNGGRLVYDLEEVKLLPPVQRPNIIFDNMLYEGHIRHMDTLPDVYYRRPVWVTQCPSTCIGSGQDIFKPKYSQWLDFEMELGFYIGKKGKDIPPEKAMDYVAGFTIYNDISARDEQIEEVKVGLGPSKGKHFEHGNVMGPCLVTPDELGDYKALRMRAYVNGELVADDPAGNTVHDIGAVIAWASKESYLYPGDFIALGTTDHGTTDSSKLGRWLQVGDEIRLEVEPIGSICNKVV